MPFTTTKTEELIHEKKQKDKVFAKQWDESRNEYKLIQEMVSSLFDCTFIKNL